MASQKDAPARRDADHHLAHLFDGYSDGGRFGEVEHGGEVLTGWFTFDPLAVEHEGWGAMEFDENDEDDFLWIPFPQWELAESLGRLWSRRTRNV